MSAPTTRSEKYARTQIHQIVDCLPPNQLPRLWEYLQQLLQEPVAPLYRIHEYAIATGVTDLAAQHDYYLYSQEQDDGQQPTASGMVLDNA